MEKPRKLKEKHGENRESFAEKGLHEVSSEVVEAHR